MNYCLLDGSLLVETRDPEQNVVKTAYMPAAPPPQKKPLTPRFVIYSLMAVGVALAIVAIISNSMNKTPDSLPRPDSSPAATLSPEPAQRITPSPLRTPAYSPTPYDTPVTVPSTTSTYPTPSTGTTVGYYSEDEKHRLFQAVGITQDNALIIEVAQKIGIVDSRGQQKSNFQPFVQEHYAWAARNADFIRQHVDKEKARAYVIANK